MTIHPLPGFLFARMDPESPDRIGKILIPQSAGSRRRGSFTGTVVQVNETPSSIRGLLGLRCLFAGWTGAEFIAPNGDRLTRYRLSRSEVLAVYDEDGRVFEDLAAVTVCGEDGVRRCPRCRTAGQGNMILDGDGYCQRCNRNAAGDRAPEYRYRTPEGTELKTRHPVTVTEAESEAMNRSPKKLSKRVALTGGWKKT